MKLPKTLTGISSEFFVMAELSRRGYNATITFGNTKAIDLLVEYKGKTIMIQVKGIQKTKSICWNVSESTLREGLFFVFVNLHVDTMQSPEYFIMTNDEVDDHLKRTKSGRNYIDYNYVKRLDVADKWSKIQ